MGFRSVTGISGSISESENENENDYENENEAIRRRRDARLRRTSLRVVRSLGDPALPSHQPILKLPLTRNTALTIAKAMNPTRTNTARSTPLAITFVNRLSWFETFF